MNPPNMILRNSLRCIHCGQEIESRHRHNFRSCSCGEVAVDGGRDYLRRIGTGWVDTSIPAQVEESDPTALVIAETFMEQLRTGRRPSPDDYADAPLLKDWRTHERRIGRRPEVILIGTVTGHPDFPDGTLIATGHVLAGDEARGWARTTRRYYRLGNRQSGHEQV